MRARVAAWQSGTRESQTHVALTLLAIIAASFVVSVTAPEWMPLAVYFVWLVVAIMLLQYRPLVVVGVVNAAAGVAAVAINGPITGSRAVAMVAFLVAVVLVLVVASRQRSGLPAMLSEVFLAELRDRLQAQGRIPPLPEGWDSQSAMIASHGVTYAGDFLVADLREDPKRLEVILVDVCGKGTGAGPAALQFAGALGGLIGAMPPRELFRAANDFLIRQGGRRGVRHRGAPAGRPRGRQLPGHQRRPPAGAAVGPAPREWVIDNARGTALGVLRSPELHISEGLLCPGEGLLFYTDGIVEERGSHLDAGIAWLQGAARDAIADGFDGAARRIVAQVESGDDDRAVLILSRTISPIG